MTPKLPQFLPSRFNVGDVVSRYDKGSPIGRVVEVDPPFIVVRLLQPDRKTPVPMRRPVRGKADQYRLVALEVETLNVWEAAQ